MKKITEKLWLRWERIKRNHEWYKFNWREGRKKRTTATKFTRDLFYLFPISKVNKNRNSTAKRRKWNFFQNKMCIACVMLLYEARSALELLKSDRKMNKTQTINYPIRIIYIVIDSNSHSPSSESSWLYLAKVWRIEYGSDQKIEKASWDGIHEIFEWCTAHKHEDINISQHFTIWNKFIGIAYGRGWSVNFQCLIEIVIS